MSRFLEGALQFFFTVTFSQRTLYLCIPYLVTALRATRWPNKSRRLVSKAIRSCVCSHKVSTNFKHSLVSSTAKKQTSTAYKQALLTALYMHHPNEYIMVKKAQFDTTKLPASTGSWKAHTQHFCNGQDQFLVALFSRLSYHME